MHVGQSKNAESQHTEYNGVGDLQRTAHEVRFGVTNSSLWSVHLGFPTGSRDVGTSFTTSTRLSVASLVARAKGIDMRARAIRWGPACRAGVVVGSTEAVSDAWDGEVDPGSEIDGSGSG